MTSKAKTETGNNLKLGSFLVGGRNVLGTNLTYVSAGISCLIAVLFFTGWFRITAQSLLRMLFGGSIPINIPESFGIGKIRELLSLVRSLASDGGWEALNLFLLALYLIPILNIGHAAALILLKINKGVLVSAVSAALVILAIVGVNIAFAGINKQMGGFLNVGSMIKIVATPWLLIGLSAVNVFISSKVKAY
ncbi:MAG: hypothetical protein FWF06_07155 [Symbiobacteriaceae bacterium]|nr:hypothetical protein [Symbiobacteriaceae bacterium]